MLIKPELPKLEGGRIQLQVRDDLSFSDIKDIAKEKAMEVSPDVMLLS